jgi:hypothetical protein
MAEKKLNPEEQKLLVRRRLMKMAIYSIPAIASVLATEEDAYSGGDDDHDDWGSGSGSGSGIGGGKGKKPKKKFRKNPKARKNKKHGLS